MNKGDFIDKVAHDAGLSKKTANRVVDSFLQRITKRLKKGKRISFLGFGTFRVSLRKKHKGRNPRTGEVIKIPASMVPKFSAGSKLRKAVNQIEQAGIPLNSNNLS
jgi:DNA-binding protein HU-beta